jgi:ATP-dependent Clp protease ATP-binding subunit ClpC
MRIAPRVSAHYGGDDIEPVHLFLALLLEGDGIPVRLMRRSGQDLGGLVRALEQGAARGSGSRASGSPIAREAPTLSRFGRDLTHDAGTGRLTPVFGRDAELKRLAQTLLRKTKSNPLIIGEAGVGKSALVYGLASYLLRADAPAPLKGKRIVQLSLSAVVAGTKYRGEFEERIQRILDETRSNENVILFIDEIHTVVGAGSASGSLDAANILKPALANGELCCIGATTTDEYHRYIASDEALARRFQVIHVTEPTLEQTGQILIGLRPSFEKHHGVKITDDALVAAVQLAARYLPSRNFPDKAIDLLDTACTQVLVMSRDPRRGGANEPSVVDKQTVVSAVSQIVDEPIPEGELSEEDASRAVRLEERLGMLVVGQDEAVTTVSRLMRAHVAGLSSPRRPIAVLLFVGPTGVGKTELARALAVTWFGGEQKLLRFDMSEYMEKHNVARLIGAPPGYVGYEEEGQLGRAVRSHPYSVVLLDEVEKAHSEVLDVFLQVFDAGHLTDAKGRIVDFTNTVVIMTSNVGSAGDDKPRIGLTIRDGQSELDQKLREAVRTTFRPEFLNRIDSVVVFRPLENKDVLRRILDNLLEEVSGYVADRKLRLEVDEELCQLLIREGCSSEYGARNLRRVMERHLRDPLADFIIGGRYQPGDTLRAGLSLDGKVTFTPTRGAGG